MDFLNKAYAQLVDLFRSMTPGARITAGLLLAVVVISLGYLFTSSVAGPDAYLMNGYRFSPDDLPEMEAAFKKAGLTDYEVVSNQIRVPKGKQADYMGALADGGALPHDFSDYFDEALEKANPFESSRERAERMKVAKQKELAAWLRGMPGIQGALVMYDSHTQGGLKRETITTASVALKVSGSQALPPERVAAIRHTVAGAIAGLEPENVNVADSSGRTYHGASGPDGMVSPMDDPYFGRKAQYEQWWEQKILNNLSYIPGVVVSVNAELDPRKLHRQEKVVPDKKPTPVSIVETEKSRSRDGGTHGGQVGYESQAANVPGAVTRVQGPGIREKDEESSLDQQNLVTGDHTWTEFAGLIPEEVSVSIAIPSNYIEKAWQKAHPTGAGQEPKPADPAELKRIEDETTSKVQKSVGNIITVPEGVADKAQLVTVTTFPYIDPTEIPVPGAGENALAWLGANWSTLLIAVLVLVSLVMLRSTIVSAGQVAEAEPSAMISARVEANADEAEEEEVAAAHTARFKDRGHSLRDDLEQLVRDDPETAANILRTWIGSPTPVRPS